MATEKVVKPHNNGTCEIVGCFSKGSTFVEVDIGNNRTISVLTCEVHAISWGDE